MLSTAQQQSRNPTSQPLRGREVTAQSCCFLQQQHTRVVVSSSQKNHQVAEDFLLSTRYEGHQCTGCSLSHQWHAYANPLQEEVGARKAAPWQTSWILRACFSSRTTTLGSECPADAHAIGHSTVLVWGNVVSAGGTAGGRRPGWCAEPVMCSSDPCFKDYHRWKERGAVLYICLYSIFLLFFSFTEKEKKKEMYCSVTVLSWRHTTDFIHWDGTNIPKMEYRLQYKKIISFIGHIISLR